MSMNIDVSYLKDEGASPSVEPLKLDTPSQDNDHLGDTPRNALSAPDTQNVEDKKPQWYVLRIPYQKAKEAQGKIERMQIRTYLPVQKIVDEKDGRYTYKEQPCVPNVLFVYCNRTTLRMLVKETPGSIKMAYQYNYCEFDRFGKNPLLVIPEYQMENFMKLMYIDNKDIVNVTDQDIHFKSNDVVLITEGPFKGIKGRVARVKGATRVVVELDYLCTMATAYIPKKAMMVVEKEYKSIWHSR